jgi:hypothetical protein
MSLYSLENNSPGRVASDFRFCEGTDISFSNESSETAGTLTIDFGSLGCADGKGNVRKGKIILNYSGGPVGSVGFTVVTTFDNYYINGIKLEGTRTIERQASESQSIIIHTIDLENGKATWPDGTFATRTSSFTRTVNLGTTITLTGTASGTGRKDRSYTMTIQEALVYKTACIAEGIYMAVDGKKTFTTDNTKQITIEFGDGTCDKVVTLTINGQTKDVTIGKN